MDAPTSHRLAVLTVALALLAGYSAILGAHSIRGTRSHQQQLQADAGSASTASALRQQPRLDLDWFPSMAVAKIPSPAMFPDEASPIIHLLDKHDIRCLSAGSWSHTLMVPRKDAARTQDLLAKHFPWVELIDIKTAE